MTQEEKQLLLQDLCARLPYRPIIHVENYTNNGKLLDMYDWNLLDVVYFQDKLELSIEPNWDNYRTVKLGYRNYIIKPYLRQMSDMTEDERKYIADKCGFAAMGPIGGEFALVMPVTSTDWLIDFYNSHHIDWRGLIPMGLALKAKEGMYEHNKGKTES